MNERKKRGNQSGYNVHLERPDATPEEVARMVMDSRPKGLNEGNT